MYILVLRILFKSFTYLTLLQDAEMAIPSFQAAKKNSTVTSEKRKISIPANR